MKQIKAKALKSIYGADISIKRFVAALKNQDGGTIVQEGTLAAGAVAAILLIVGLAIAFTKDAWFPQFQAKLTEIFNMG